MKAKRFILQWIWLLPLLFWFVITVQANLSVETKEIVEDLRWKHNPFISYTTQPDIEWWVQQYPYIEFEDGILYIVDGDVTWFIEMQRKEE